jgi:hypothetical protein
MKFDIWVFFYNKSRKLKFHKDLKEIGGTSNEEQCTFLSHLLQFFLAYGMLHTKVKAPFCGLFGTEAFVEAYCTLAPSPDTQRTLLAKEGTDGIWPVISQFSKRAGLFYMPQSWDMGQIILLPLWRKGCYGFFQPEKSDGFGRKWTRDLGYQRPAC